MKRYVLRGVVLLLVVGSAGFADGEPIVTTDLLRLRTVGSIDVTDDGSKAVVAVRSIGRVEPGDGQTDDDNDNRPSYENQSHLVVLNLSDDETGVRQLTFGQRNDSNPTFSPDGQRIAFERKQKEGKSQIWVINVGGGEARQVSFFENGGAAPVWSPDGHHLLVQSRVKMREIEGVPPWPMERPRRNFEDARADTGVPAAPAGTLAAIRAWLARNASDGDPLVINRIGFQEEQKLREGYTFQHLFLIELENPEKSSRRITNGFYDHREAAFMPDGESIVYVARKPVEQHPDRVIRDEIWSIDLDGANDQPLLYPAGWSVDSPKVYLDGSMIAFRGEQTDEPAFRQKRLGIYMTADDEFFWVTDQLDASVRGFTWEMSRANLLFTIAREGGFPLLIAGPSRAEPVAMVERDENTELPVGVHEFDMGGGTIVFSKTSASNPCELMVLDAEGQRVAYELNPWVKEKTLATPAPGSITRPDGEQIQYWLMEPTDRIAGKAYPLAVEIHGGPSAMWGPGERTMWLEFQLLCSWGYGVVYANPRGSGGYGYNFQRGNFQDWGAGPAGDVLAVVDHVILTEWIDSDRLVVTGGSYGGYLTAWIIAHDNRFKAAVAQRGVYDLRTFFGEGNAWRLVEWAFGGYPWDSRLRRIFNANSPITDVSDIHTPLLILHASQDLRTGVSQSEMLFRSLKALNREVEYVRYPDAGHDLSRTGDPRHRMDRLNRIIEFFERYIENDRPAPAVSDPRP